MGISGVFKRGQKEDKFVLLLIEQGQKTVEGLKLLEEWLKEPDLDRTAVEEMRKKEVEADEVRRIIIDELHNTFITPLDREDIFMLSLYIDDMLDYAYSTIEEMDIFSVGADDHLLEMVSLNRQAAEEILLAVQRLSANPRVAGDHARRAKKLENEVEGLYRTAIGDLFKKAKDFKQIMTMLKRREVYRHISNMANQANDAADILGMIVMKLT